MGKMGKGLRLKSFYKVVEIGLEAQPSIISALGIGSSIDTKEDYVYLFILKEYPYLWSITKTLYLSDWVRRAV